jgi:hypothetical protein
MMLHLIQFLLLCACVWAIAWAISRDTAFGDPGYWRVTTAFCTGLIGIAMVATWFFVGRVMGI